MKYLLLTFITLLGLKAVGQQLLLGRYVSNFALGGYVETNLSLLQDSTFIFKFEGDMAYGYGEGTYHVIGDSIFLNYRSPLKDSNNFNQWIELSRMKYWPTKYLFQWDRLYEIDSLGNTAHYYLSGNGQDKLYWLQNIEGYYPIRPLVTDSLLKLR